MDRPRLWPAAVITALLAASLAWPWIASEVMGQQRTLRTGAGLGTAGILLLLWLVFLSRLSRRLRLAGLAAVLLLVGSAATLVRIRGVSGDLVPILEPRWSRETSPGPVSAPATPLGPVASPAETPSAAPEAPPLVTTAPAVATRPAVPSRHAGDFPQFLGARRDGTVTGVRLARDWSTRRPRRLWRHQVGEGWSGFAAVGDVAVTQEQRGGEERVVAFDLLTGRLRWSHSDAARFDTVIGGIG